MPLYPEAERLIRGNLSVIKRGKKPRAVVIGELTPKQLADINAYRAARGWDPLQKEVVFVGSHLYASRILKDGYSEEDLLVQIRSAMSEECCFVPTSKMTVLQHPRRRDGGYGCMVRDELTLECTTRFPRAELFSVVPRGDMHHKPVDVKKAASLRPPSTI